MIESTNAPIIKEDFCYSNEYIKAKSSAEKLENKYGDKLEINYDLDRKLVSFQGNKVEPIFRWFHYREGFSRTLIEYILDKIDAPTGGHILDPFAGTGTAPFVGANYKSMSGYAVELLPVGAYFIECRNLFASLPNKTLIDYARIALASRNEWLKTEATWNFNHLSITNFAFSTETENELCKYKTWLNNQQKDFSIFLDFIAFCVLEKISYTRKDGQYLRWDYRSKRYEVSKQKTKFDKGEIFGFYEAIEDKLNHIIQDLEEDDNQLFKKIKIEDKTQIKIIQGSILDKIELIEDESIDCIITSPPYCNRYDYTRTYALELAYLGVNEDEIRRLRQSLLTCTVENKPKQFEWLESEIKVKAENAFFGQQCLQDSLKFLESEKKNKKLNNPGIYTMVNGYFYETAIHLAQALKKIKPGGYYIMVNDNVRYNGLDLPVDCILSDIAESVGFTPVKIWVLPKGKGNSSQQMKIHGRSELRKCIYIWKK